MSSSVLMKRGEVWKVCLDPTVGDEMQKTRPCVVLSSDGIGRLRLKTVVPITAPAKEQTLWHVPISPHTLNGLSKPSVADALQIRALSYSRFVTKLGRLTAQQMDDIAAAVAIVLEIQ